MITYELDINLIDNNRDILIYIDTNESELKRIIEDICTIGIHIDDNNNKMFIPAHRIDNVKYKILERIQEVHDLNESIKSALS